MAKEDVEKRGDLSTGGIGAGPYIVTEYVKGEKTVFKRNPDYFDKEALPRYVELAGHPDMTTLFQAYKTDQIDINGALLTKLDYDDLLNNPT